MAASAYKAILTFKNLKTGQNFDNYVSASDVAAALVTFQDGQTTLNTGSNPVALVDVQVQGSTGATDCPVVKVLANGYDTSKRIIPNSNFASSNNRQISMANAIGFNSGVLITLVQSATA